MIFKFEKGLRAVVGASVLASLASIAAASLAGCGGSSAPNGAAAPSEDRVVRVHRSKCGACHVRVEPGARTREELEHAFVRHRSRVRLSEEEWARMVDYLAKPEDHASQVAPTVH